jgi:hypothetical protein
MKLREAIKNIFDDDWLEISEETKNMHKSRIGRAPKKYITGDVLDYEVKYIGGNQDGTDYTLYKVTVKNNRNS